MAFLTITVLFAFTFIFYPNTPYIIVYFFVFDKFYALFFTFI